MTELELLKAARAVIQRQRAVPLDALARDAFGHRCEFDDPAAVTFCAVGALAICNGHDVRDLVAAPALLRLGYATKALGFAHLAELNDRGGRTAVLACYDAAIAELEATS